MFEMFKLPPHADPLGLPFAGSPWAILLTVSSYLLFVLNVGPKLMELRNPFKLKGVLKVYNIFQILFNGILLLVSLYIIIILKPYDLKCLVIMPLDNKLKDLDRAISYLYYINKIIDLLDTIFFVLRKSYKQITALHLIHHVSMPTITYFWQRAYGYGGHFIFAGLLNVFVHTVMYTYYYLSSEYPQIRQNNWWKKYLTILQMVQFVLMCSHSIFTYLQPNCAVPRVMISIVTSMSSLMFVMFFNFYRKSYVQTKQKAA